jgi:hypothetical protein
MIFGCLQTSRVAGDKTIYVGDKKLSSSSHGGEYEDAPNDGGSEDL